MTWKADWVWMRYSRGSCAILDTDADLLEYKEHYSERKSNTKIINMNCIDRNQVLFSQQVRKYFAHFQKLEKVI